MFSVKQGWIRVLDKCDRSQDAPAPTSHQWVFSLCQTPQTLNGDPFTGLASHLFHGGWDSRVPFHIYWDTFGTSLRTGGKHGFCRFFSQSAIMIWWWKDRVKGEKHQQQKCWHTHHLKNWSILSGFIIIFEKSLGLLPKECLLIMRYSCHFDCLLLKEQTNVNTRNLPVVGGKYISSQTSMKTWKSKLVY